MADQINLGEALVIPDDIFKNIDKLDKAIDDVAVHSESMSKKFHDHIGNMSVDLNPLIEKLKSISTIMDGVSASKESPLKNFFEGVGNASKQAEHAAEQLSKVSVALNKINSSITDIAQNKEAIKAISDLSKMEDLNAINKKKNTAIEEAEAIKREREEIKRKTAEEKRAKSEETAASINAHSAKMDAMRKEKAEQKAADALQKRYLDALAMTESTELSRIKKIERLKSVYQEMRHLMGENAKQTEAAANALNVLTSENKRLAESRDKLRSREAEIRNEERALRAYDKAMAASENTYTQSANKIVKLKAAQELLNRSAEKYPQELKKIEEELKRLNAQYREQRASYQSIHKSQSKLFDTSSQLARKLALVFSVSQVQGYLMNVVRITGEFEKQNVALASILQNKDQADILFGKIQKLAVKSPFQLKELVTYTKSLSAYQVEYEKLYDTTKRLADVSAGLGVDMQRLILAFGQVKAANFLRGTEVRQFTEAGLNILGELAKYYSELEGKMVSVADVQERVTKRMVAFGDVEEIFKRVTSAGGIFYEMQERQAETIAGQWSNLQDSIDIAMNEIGSSNKNMIKDVIRGIRRLIENWETVARATKPAIVAFGTYLAVGKLLIPLIKNIKGGIVQMGLSITKAGWAQKNFNKAAAANAWLTAGTLIISIISSATASLSAMKEEQRKLNEIASQGYLNSEKSVADYERLANTVSDTTKSYKEQEQALEELRRKYSDILPDQYLQAKAIREMAGNYDEATAAIRNYISMKTKEKQLLAIGEKYESRIQVQQEDISSYIRDSLRDIYNAELSESDINAMLAKVRSDFDKGLISSSKDAGKRINEILTEYLGKEISLGFQRVTGGYVINMFDTMLYQLEEYRRESDRITSGATFRFADKVTRDLDAKRKSLDEQINKANELLNALGKQGELGKDGALITQDVIDDSKKKLSEIVSAWGVDTKKIEKLTGSAFDIRKLSEEIKKAAYKSFGEGLTKGIDNKQYTEKQVASVKYFIQQMNQAVEGMKPSRLQEHVETFIAAQATLNGLSLDNFINVFANADESIGNYGKRLEGIIKSLSQEIQGLERSTSWQVDYDPIKRTREEEEKELETKKDMLKVLTLLLPTIKAVNDTKKVGHGRDTSLDNLKEQIRLIREAAAAYRKYREIYDSVGALGKIKEDFEGSSVESIINSMKDFDSDDIIKAFVNLNNKAGKEGEKARQKAIREERRKGEEEAEKEFIERTKSAMEQVVESYDFGQELLRKGIDPESFKNLLRTLGVSDEQLLEFGLDTKTLEEAEVELQAKISELRKKGGDEDLKLAEAYTKKIHELYLNEAKSRFDELLELRKKYMTKEDQIKNIEKQIAKWKEELKSLTEESNAEQKELLELRIKNGYDAIDKLRTESLELSDFWMKLFGNLDDLSLRSIKDLLRQREELINSAEEFTDEDGKKKYKASYVDSEGVKHDVIITRKQLEQLLKSKERFDKEFSKRSPIELFFRTLFKGKEKGEKTDDFIRRLTNDFLDAGDAAFDASKDFLSLVGASDKTKKSFESAEKIWGGTKDIAKGVASFYSGDFIGGSLQALKGVSQVMQGINAIHDEKREKEIQKELALIENLEKSYEKLKEAIESAYDVDMIESTTKAMNEALKAQNAALQRSIAAEEDKKKKDQKRIDEWYGQIEENNKKIEENMRAMYESFGAFGSDENLKSAASEFTSAWLSSFKDVGDGMQGLMENMQNWVQNAVQKQLLTNLGKRFITPILEDFDKMFDESSVGGTRLTPEELAAWKKLYEEKSKEFDALASKYIESLEQAGIDFGKDKADKLSGLQRGIESVSESTAEVLAAITESIRWFSADSNAKLGQILAALSIPNPDNPFLMELKLQTEQLRLMSSLWNSLTTTKVGIKGKVLQTVLV